MIDIAKSELEPKICAIITIKEFFNRRNCLLILFLFILGSALYYRSLNAKLYGDDYIWTYKEYSNNIFKVFYSPGALTTSDNYRPMQGIVAALNFKFFDDETYFLHAVSLSTHILFSILIFIFLRLENSTFMESVIASLYMLVSQTNTAAIVGNDTISQIFAPFFASISVFVFYRFLKTYDSKERPLINIKKNWIILFVSMFFFLLSILSKETSISYLAIIMVLVIYKKYFVKRNRILLPDALMIIFLYVLFLIVYFSMRNNYVTNEIQFDSTGRTSFNFGVNVFINIALLLGSITSPFATSEFFKNLANNSPISVLFIIGSLVFLIIIFWGFMKGNRKLLITYALFGIITLFPMALMNHVSDLYTYNSSAFWSIFIAISLLSLFVKYCNKSINKIIFICFLAVFFSINFISSSNKMKKMLENGERSERYYNGIVKCVSSHPESKSVAVFMDNKMDFEYSIYYLSDYKLFKYGANKHIENAFKNRIKLNILPLSSFESEFSSEYDLILIGKENRIEKYLLNNNKTRI